MPLFELGRDPFANLNWHHNPEFVPPAPQPTRHRLAADAVRAAVRVMNNLKSAKADIMGEMSGIESWGVPDKQTFSEDFSKTEALLKAANSAALSNQHIIGMPRLIRLGLLTDEWLSYRDRLCRVALEATLVKQEAGDFHERAFVLASEIQGAIQRGRALDARNPYTVRQIPWKGLLFGVGFITIGIVGWRLWSAYKEPPKSSQLED